MPAASALFALFFFLGNYYERQDLQGRLLHKRKIHALPEKPRSLQGRVRKERCDQAVQQVRGAQEGAIAHEESAIADQIADQEGSKGANIQESSRIGEQTIERNEQKNQIDCGAVGANHSRDSGGASKNVLHLAPSER
jgi:hypothetical protein